MTDTPAKTITDYVLPADVVSKIDLSRLIQEAERIDNEMITASVRSKAGSESGITPVLSDRLRNFLDLNNLSFDDSNGRTALIKQLRQLKDKAPAIHMTFAVVADGQSLQQITKWVRDTVHPQALVEVGLQPALVGGVYVRTPNHVHDMSLRAKLKDGHQILLTELEAARGAE